MTVYIQREAEKKINDTPVIDTELIKLVDSIEEYPKELVVTFNEKSIYSGSLTIKKDKIVHFEVWP